MNQSQTLLGYVTKQKNGSETANSHTNHCSDNNGAACEEFYRAFVIELTTDDKKIHDLDIERRMQVRIQFLYREKEQSNMDRFLLLTHHECK